MSKRVEVHSDLPFSASRVWSVLSDIESYPEWNPQFISAKGSATLDSILELRVNPPSGKGQPYDFRAKIVDLVPERSLVWEGGFRPILWGRHFFNLRKRDGGVLLTHGEAFQGLYPFWIGQRGVDALRPAYEAANHALEKRLSDQQN
ncbi:SRPBCC domain-containing protein [Gymnodinialimonas sp. 2305UL16-5]|uniref:SRPBCC domain-containing protein n=1 Tax=Gymnodinialimonas mytili TaxID=3126503 RepID=UPI0030A84DFD